MEREKVITLLRLVKENGLKIDIAADEICSLFSVSVNEVKLICGHTNGGVDGWIKQKPKQMNGKQFLEEFDPQIKEVGYENYSYTPEQVIQRLNAFKEYLKNKNK